MIAAVLRRRIRTGAPGRSPARAGDDRVTQEQATPRRMATPSAGTSPTRRPHLLSLQPPRYQCMQAGKCPENPCRPTASPRRSTIWGCPGARARVVEDVKQPHITVTNYCPVLDRFIDKNPGYVSLIDSGNPGTNLRAAVMPRLLPVCDQGCAATLHLSGKLAKGCRMNAPQ